jgi:hypothetical protein
MPHPRQTVMVLLLLTWVHPILIDDLPPMILSLAVFLIETVDCSGSADVHHHLSHTSFPPPIALTLTLLLVLMYWCMQQYAPKSIEEINVEQSSHVRNVQHSFDMIIVHINSSYPIVLGQDLLLCDILDSELILMRMGYYCNNFERHLGQGIVHVMDCVGVYLSKNRS